MKKILFATIAFLLLNITLFAQGGIKISSAGSMMGMPRYILADNANPAVIVIFREFLPQKTDTYDPNTSYAPKDIAEMYNLSPKIYNLLLKYMKEDFEKIGLKPAVFINLGEERANAESNEVAADNAVRKKLFEHKSKYTINLVVSKYPSEERIAKDSATRSDYTNLVFTLNKYRGGSVLSPDADEFGYLLYINNYADFTTTLKKKIGKVDSTRYIKRLRIQDTTTVFREIKELEEIPDDLDKYGTLLCKYGGSVFFDQEMNEKLDTKMKKNFKFKYSMVDRLEVPMYMNADYKYIIEYKTIPYKVTAGDKANPTSATQMERQEVYYVIRDMHTDDIYYCGDIDEVKASDDPDPVKALDLMIERINNHYKNDKK